jgi:hypothetical protein
VTACRFQTSSEHSTSLGRVRYQRCVCGRFRVLLDYDVLTQGPPRTAALLAAQVAPQWNQPDGMTQRTDGDTLDVDVVPTS